MLTLRQTMSELNSVIKHLRNKHEFESGVNRDKSRRNITHEFFTPNELVDMGINLLDDTAWLPQKTFIDTSCGDGQLLSGIIIKKIQMGSTYQQALDTIYGIEFEIDNCLLCIHRLFGVFENPKISVLTDDTIPVNWRSPGLKAVFEVNGKICNIVCADGLKYNYSFGESDDIIIQPSEELTFKSTVHNPELFAISI